MKNLFDDFIITAKAVRSSSNGSQSFYVFIFIIFGKSSYQHDWLPFQALFCCCCFRIYPLIDFITCTYKSMNCKHALLSVKFYFSLFFFHRIINNLVCMCGTKMRQGSQIIRQKNEARSTLACIEYHLLSSIYFKYLFIISVVCCWRCRYILDFGGWSDGCGGLWIREKILIN